MLFKYEQTYLPKIYLQVHRRIYPLGEEFEISLAANGKEDNNVTNYIWTIRQNRTCNINILMARDGENEGKLICPSTDMYVKWMQNDYSNFLQRYYVWFNIINILWYIIIF